ncbi:MAG: ThiF family adenylyltransferase [Microbacterium sp.]|uniref:ThiF family adenylyltransferase n=1 Tax=Microbacterium sp. TaxID=51671 RepID=UPI003A8A90A6
MPLPPIVEPVARLSEAERARTTRHRSLAALGETGQRRLRAAHVAVMGAGGLGSPVILALAAAGVGTITVIDDDVVDASNLQRQVVHRHADVGAPKTASAVRVASDLSPETHVVEVRERLHAGNAAALLAGADLVVDGADTIDTRQDVAIGCERLGIPLVWGAVQEFHAQVTVFWSAPPDGVEPVHLTDLHPRDSAGEPPTCAMVGVLGALCLQVGGLLATEAIKLIAGIGEPLLGRVLLIDALTARHREVPLHRAVAPDVPAAAPAPVPFVSADAIADAAVVIDVREAHEVAGGMIPGAVHLPLGELLERVGGAGPGVAAPAIVVCQTSVRARRAVEALQTAGIEASVLGGGMAAWTGATVTPAVVS